LLFVKLKGRTIQGAFAGAFFYGTVVKSRKFMHSSEWFRTFMTCPRLTDRQLLALLAVEKECPDESKGISPDQLAVSMELKGADTSRVARSILNQLNKKDLVQKSLLSEGMGRGIVSYYSLSPFAKKILSQHHLEPMILQPRKALIAPASAVLYSQTPPPHARLFCCRSILRHFLRDEPAHWRQLYAHSTAGERRTGLRQMHTITSAKVLRHHIYGS
jgi:hypothetical protein